MGFQLFPQPHRPPGTCINEKRHHHVQRTCGGSRCPDNMPPEPDDCAPWYIFRADGVQGTLKPKLCTLKHYHCKFVSSTKSWAVKIIKLFTQQQFYIWEKVDSLLAWFGLYFYEYLKSKDYVYLGLLWICFVSQGIPPRLDSNRPAQLQKLSGVLEF